MQPAVLIRLTPAGPWRYGPGDGGGNRIDLMFRSDRVYSAITLAMRHLGFLEEWLDVTARNSTSSVTFSSLFPYQSETLFVPPPLTLWPPPSSSVSTASPAFLTKLRWKAARFVPLTLVESILRGESILADQWIADPESGCLLRRDRPSTSPCRVVVRSSVSVDRMTHNTVRIDKSACVEFEASSGLWGLVRFADASAEATWNLRLQGAFRLLADTGFGAHRTRGWGQTEEPRFEQGEWPALLFPKLGRNLGNGSHTADQNDGVSLYWLLSLYSPSAIDTIDWSGGNYEPTLRGGRVEGAVGSGVEKKPVRMISEGSVLAAPTEPAGVAVDVAPDAFAHPVYRSGLALALKLPDLNRLEKQGPVERPTEEDLEAWPCKDVKPGDVKPEEDAQAREMESGVPSDEPANPEQMGAEPDQERNL